MVNVKRIRLLYLREGLKLRSKPRKKLIAAAVREKPIVPDCPNLRWSMDFMRDALGSGRPFRTFNVIDDGSRESLVIEVDFSLPAERVVRVLEKIAGSAVYLGRSSSTTARNSSAKRSTSGRLSVA
jgi:putative transposase